MNRWAQQIIGRFMNGLKVDHSELEEACSILRISIATIATCRNAAREVTRGLDKHLVLTPMNGQRVARAR